MLIILRAGETGQQQDCGKRLGYGDSDSFTPHGYRKEDTEGRKKSEVKLGNHSLCEILIDYSI